MIETLVVASSVVLAVGIAFLLQGPPHVPSDDESAAQMLAMTDALRPRKILDMGSGKGKLVILLAQRGYRVDGVEINPLLVWRSRRAIKKAGLQGKAVIKWQSFWRFDASPYDLVTLYAIKHIMPRLEKKLTAELTPARTSCPISLHFQTPGQPKEKAALCCTKYDKRSAGEPFKKLRPARLEFAAFNVASVRPSPASDRVLCGTIPEPRPDLCSE